MKQKLEPEMIGVQSLLQEYHPPIEYFLRPLVFPGSLLMLYAPTGIGKTFASLSMAAAVASGGTFLKWKAERPGKVWYVDGEMSPAALQRRIGKLAPDGTTPVTDENFIFTRPIPGKPLLCISNKSHHKWILEKAKEFDFIIFDNYGCLTQRTKDESDVAIWSRVKPLLLGLRAHGKSVCLIHHSGKSNDYLGTSEKTQPLDWLIKLSRPDEYTPGGGAKFTLEFQKERDGWGEDLSAISVSLEDSPSGLRWEWMGRHKDLERQVQRRRDLNMTDAQIAKELGQPFSVIRAIEKIVEEVPNDYGRGGIEYDDRNF